MEKICIVKRRREYAQTEVKLILPDNLSETFEQLEAAARGIVPDKQPESPEKKQAEEILPAKGDASKQPAPLDQKIVEEFLESNTYVDEHPDFFEKKTEAKLIVPDNLDVNLPSEVSISSVAIDKQPESQDKKIVEEFTDKTSSVISITMTKEQSEQLSQSEYIRELLSGEKSDPLLDIKLNPDGRISLNYRFNESLVVRMLSPQQVCQMLQISRGFLQKIVNEKKLTSYKLGRMRRFLLEDILEYLSSDIEG